MCSSHVKCLPLCGDSARSRSQRCCSHFAGSNPHRLAHLADEDLAVTDFPGPCGLGDLGESSVEYLSFCLDQDERMRLAATSALGLVQLASKRMQTSCSRILKWID